MTRRTPPRRRTILLAALAVWLALSAIGGGLHVLADRAARGAASGVALESAIKPLANLCDVLTLGGWPLARRVAARFDLDPFGVAVVASAIGLGCWLLVGCVAVIVRRGLLARPAVTPRDAAPAPHAAGTSDVDLSRRRLLVDGVFGAAAITGGGAVVRAAVFEPIDLQLRRYTVPIADLPRGLDGLRVVQLADTHLGPNVSSTYIADAIDRTLALAPDLVVLTGDYVHGGARQIGPAADLFRPLTAARAGLIGVVGVLGNHDWYADGPASADALGAVGVRMIDNARVFLDAGSRTIVPHEPDGPALCIAGVGDLLEDVVDPERALGGVFGGTPRLLLSHNPDVAEHPRTARAGRIDLMLSGHTHGGQVRLPLLGTPIVPSAFGGKYAGGLVEGPTCRVLITRGVGVSVLPVRLGVPPELVEITLVRA